MIELRRAGPHSLGVVRPLASISFLALCLAGMARAAELPPGAKRAGFVITAEGGVEGGTQVMRYDADGRPLDGSARPSASRPSSAQGPRPAGATSVVESAPAAPSSAKTGATELRTADGRKVPFTMEGQGNKTVDGAVDFNASLKKASKSSDIMEKKFDTTMAPIGKEQVYSRNNLLTLDTWHGRYDTFGRKKSDIAVEDTLGATVRQKETVEVKSIDRTTSAVNGSKAQVKDWENRMGVDTNARYTGVKSSWQEKLNGAPKTVNQLSMQDINRYQFRRNQSSDPGLPVVKPGSDTVKSTGAPK